MCTLALQYLLHWSIEYLEQIVNDLVKSACIAGMACITFNNTLPWYPWCMNMTCMTWWYYSTGMHTIVMIGKHAFRRMPEIQCLVFAWSTCLVWHICWRPKNQGRWGTSFGSPEILHADQLHFSLSCAVRLQELSTLMTTTIQKSNLRIGPLTSAGFYDSDDFRVACHNTQRINLRVYAFCRSLRPASPVLSFFWRRSKIWRVTDPHTLQINTALPEMRFPMAVGGSDAWIRSAKDLQRLRRLVWKDRGRS